MVKKAVSKQRIQVKGDGTVFYDSTRRIYRCQLIIGINPVTGAPIRKSASADSKREAKAKLDEMKLLFKKYRPNLAFMTATTAEWMEHYITEYMSANNRPSTLSGIWLNYEKHIKPHVGRIRLTELTGSDLQCMYNALTADGRVDGKGGLSSNTIKRIHNIVHQALEQAFAEDIIVKNVSKQVVLPKGRAKAYQPYGSEEMNRLIMETRDEWLHPAIVTLIFSGLRRSELLGLSWSDIDFDAKVIKINKAYTNQGKKKPDESKQTYALAPTKTEKSNRSIPMAQQVSEALLLRKRELQIMKLKSGKSDFNKMDMVFVDQEGVLINGSQFTQRFKSILKKHGLREIRVHDLRHSFASQSLKSGAKIESVRDMLGHSNIQTTLNIYRHVELEEKQADIERLSDIVKASGGSTR